MNHTVHSFKTGTHSSTTMEYENFLIFRKPIICKTKMIAMKSLIFIVALFFTLSSVKAQFDKSKVVFSSTKATVLQKPAIPTISSPAEGSEINGPVVFAGKAQPNAKVTINVQPIYKVPPSTDGRPVLLSGTFQNESQNFVVTANAKGLWQSPLLEVKFYDKATDRQIFVFVAQDVNGLSSGGKNIVYKVPAPPVRPRLVVGTRIYSPAKDAFVNANAPVKGIAAAGAVIEVVITSVCYLNGSDGGGIHRDGGVVKGATQNFKVKTDSKGRWETPDVNFNVNKKADLKSQEFEITATNTDNNTNATTKVSNPGNSSAETASFSVSGPADYSSTKGKVFVVKGSADPGAKIEINITYTGQYADISVSGILNGKAKTNVQNSPYTSFKVTADENGNWSSPGISGTITQKQGVNTTVKSANSMKIVVSLKGSDGRTLKSQTINLDTVVSKGV